MRPPQSYELVLQDGGYRVVQRGPGGEPPYRVRHTGNYLTVETRSGLVLSWDRRTSVFVRLKQDYKVRPAGRGPLWVRSEPPLLDLAPRGPPAADEPLRAGPSPLSTLASEVRVEAKLPNRLSPGQNVAPAPRVHTPTRPACPLPTCPPTGHRAHSVPVLLQVHRALPRSPPAGLGWVLCPQAAP